MPERKPIVRKVDRVVEIESFQKIIHGIDGNLTKADCPTHGKEVYFERVGGDLFQCANSSHYKKRPGAVNQENSFYKQNG